MDCSDRWPKLSRAIGKGGSRHGAVKPSTLEQEAGRVITKEQMLEAIRTLPDDATVDDAIERLHFIELVERRIAAADAGETVTHEEARRRMAQWLP